MPKGAWLRCAAEGEVAGSGKRFAVASLSVTLIS